MEFIDPRLEAFASKYSNPESELLQQINRSTQVEVLKPRMLSGHLQGQFLSMISKLHQPARILEIGTYTGYSALCLVEGLQWDGDLHTIEVNDELEQRIRNHFDAHKRCHSLHLHVGAASDIIDELEGTWDLVFIDADKENYADLWKFTKAIAEKIGAPVPNNIAIGLEPTFYATSANVKVLSSDANLTGETLYISLPLMRLFTKDEFGAVVGHELGHFKGSDVAYTMKFAPLYRALSTAVDKTANEARVMSIPALAVLSFLLDRFSLAEKEISRQREFEADKVGANAVSSEALCAALIKVTAFSNLWNDLMYDVVENLEYGRPVNNLSSLYASRVAFDTDADAAGKVVRENLDFKIPHPTDTHPTLSERLDNLGGHDDHSYLQMGLLEDSSLTLIHGAIDLEKELSLVQQKLYQALGVAQYETKKPDDAEVSYGVARLIQTAAAVMVCADGRVEPSEIAEAEEKGMKMVSHFNSLEFREACLNPQALPNVADLSKTIKEVFNQQHITLMVELLSNIAAADGHVSSEEEKFIKQLSG